MFLEKSAYGQPLVRKTEGDPSVHAQQFPLVIALAFLLGVGLLIPNFLGSQQIPIPGDFSYQETKPLPPVPFSHNLHVTQKKLQCQECHIKPFGMKKLAASPDMTMAKLNEGQFCGACHNGTRAFATKEFQSCAKCHVKK